MGNIMKAKYIGENKNYSRNDISLAHDM